MYSRCFHWFSGPLTPSVQDNMCLTMHINSMSMRLAQIEEQLGQVGAIVLGIARGALEGLSTDEEDSPGAGTLDVSGGELGNQGGDKDNGDDGVSPEGSTRVGSPLSQVGGLITEMEREATEAGAGGWFNGNLEDVPDTGGEGAWKPTKTS